MTSSKIETIDRAVAKRINTATTEALKTVADDLGLQVKVSGGTIDGQVGTFAPKVEFSIDGAAERAFALDAPAFDLTPEDYGREFSYGGKSYRLTGLNTRAPRFPLKAERLPDGRRFKFPREALRD